MSVFQKSGLYLSLLFFCAINNYAQNKMPGEIILPDGSRQAMQVKTDNFSSFTKSEKNNLPQWAEVNGQEWRHHPEFGMLPHNAPCSNCVEVLEKRKADERYFVDASDKTKFYLQKGLGALHYKKNGQWLTVDSRLEAKENGIYEAGSQWDAVGFDAKKNTSYIITPQGKIDFNNWKLYGQNADVEKLLAHADWSKHTAGDDGLYVTEIFPGIDAQMTAMRGAIKTNFIVKELRYADFENLVFRDEFVFGDNYQFLFNERTDDVKQLSGNVRLVKNNMAVLEIEAATAYPKNNPAGGVFALDYMLDNNALAVVVPVKSIQQIVQHSHLVIDPLVSSSNSLAQVSITGSMYNAGCNFTNSCNYSLTVNAPAGATLTDLLWSFNYNAAFPCAMRDGAMRLRTGACISPSQSGFYWYCNSPFPGTCTGSSISVFSDLSSCLPSPSCVPQPVTFELQFFRSCVGATGCSNACIGSNSAWTMTIQGYTLEFTNPSNTITVSQGTVCFGQTITASTTTRYGVPPYNVNWSFNASGTPSIGTGSPVTVNFPSPGTYNLYASTTDACNNTVSDNRLINVNPIPTVTPGSNSPVCQGQTLSLTVNTTASANYTWSGPNSFSTSQQNPNINNATPAASGTYTVTVSASGCTASATVQATVNSNPAASIAPATASVCNGSSLTLTASGGTSYLWSTTETTAAITVSPVSNSTYNVTVTDANGCTATTLRNVSVSNPPTANITPANPAICSGNSVTLTASGGSSFLWSTTETTAAISVNPATNTSYTVTVTAANGCTASATRNVTVNALPVITIDPPVASVCLGSSITLTASGGNTYAWSNLQTTPSITVSPVTTTTYTVTATDANGCTGTASRDVTISANLVVTITPAVAAVCGGAPATLTASGGTSYLWSTTATTASITVSPVTNTTYSVTGTDANGCTGTATRDVTINPAPVISISPSTIAVCDGGTATLTASGGVNYLWSTTETTSSIAVTPLSNTTYSVTGTDANGCTAAASRQVTINQPPTVTIQPVNAAICIGESISLIADGGVSYLWSTNEADAFITVSPATNTSYSVTATDANGCTGTLTRDVAVNNLPFAAINPFNAQTCFGQPVTLTASGGNNYLWNTAETSAAISANPVATTNYSVTVTDGNNCSATASATVDVINNLSLTEQHTDANCFNANDGAINISTVGGNSPFTFLWNDNNTNEDRNNLPAGTYTVTATGSDGCAATISIDITEPTAVAITESITDESCAGNNDGSIALTASGGVAPYNYLWFDADNSNPKNNLAQGNYDVTVSDNNGCSLTLSYNIGRVAPLTVSAIPVNPSCPPAANGSVEITISGGNGGLTFIWSNNTTNEDAMNLIPGSYSVTITDSKGCSATSNVFTLDYQYVFDITASPQDTTISKGLYTEIKAVANVNNNVSFVWTPSQGLSCDNCAAPIARPLQTTTYTVVATNGAGCTDADSVLIRVEDPGTIYIPNSFSPNGDGVNDLYMVYGVKPEFMESFYFSVFDRWGERVFVSDKPDFSWDGSFKGKILNPGVFVYHLKFVLLGGDIIEERKGSILLLR